MNSALVFMTETKSFMVLNIFLPKAKGYKLIKKQAGEFAIFVGWL